MKKILQIAVLGLVSAGLVPVSLNAQDRYDGGYPANYPQGPVYSDRCEHHDRAAAIVGATTMAGAMIGAASGHAKGAAIGAMIGGVTGLIIDQAARDHHRHEEYRREEREYR